MKQVFYCSLDAILDTRLGTVSRMNQDAAAQLLCKAYYERLSDDLGDITPLITNEAYRAAYAQRDLETLKVSRVTAILPLMGAQIRKVMDGVIAGNGQGGVEIDLNIWPYKVTPSMYDMLKTCIRSYTMRHLPVNIINVPPEGLTMDRIRSSWVMMFLYDFVGWSGAISDKIEPMEKGGKRAAQVTMITPALFVSNEEAEKVKKDPLIIDGQEMNAFAATEITFAEYIGLTFEHVKLFSIIPPPVLEEETSQGNSQ